MIHRSWYTDVTPNEPDVFDTSSYLRLYQGPTNYPRYLLSFPSLVSFISSLPRSSQAPIMGVFYDEIPPFLISWIPKQHLFWVATAPLSDDGHINVSPKGLEDIFHIVNSKQVWWEDITGSGIETISHIRENRRITVLFNAFEGPPRICRIYGTATVHEFGTPEYDKYLPDGKRHAGSRSAIVIDVHKVMTSCGYGVPYFDFKGHRAQLLYALNRKEIYDRDAEEKAIACETTNDSSTTDGSQDKQGIDPSKLPNLGIRQYWLDWNLKSIDGIPGLRDAIHSRKGFISMPVPEKRKLLQDGTPAAAKVSTIQVVVGKVRAVVDFKSVVAFTWGLVVAVLYFQYARGLVKGLEYRYALPV